MIRMPPHVLTEMLDHARTEAPTEACGLLFGVDPDVRKYYRLTNVDGSSEHFSLDPKEQFAAVKDARVHGWKLLALYHSHPDSPARMSAEDLRLAYTPGIHYLVISLAEPERPDTRGFRVVDGQPVEEPVVIQEL